MLVAIHQSHYLPWLRYLEKVARSEYFIVLDDVDFTRNGWHNRNKIKTHQGPLTLTVPVRQKLGAPIKDMEISSPGWARKHWMTLQQSYGGAPFFADYRSQVESFYGGQSNWTHLLGLNQAMFDWHQQALGLNVPCALSSTLPTQGTATRRLVELIRAVGGTAYLTGLYAFDTYLDPQEFRKAGLDLFIFDWKCPEYRQHHKSAGFVPDLATLDLIFNEGGERGREILAGASRVFRYES
jgi:hypothetical protein